jgi:hypothetical protein
MFVLFYFCDNTPPSHRDNIRYRFTQFLRISLIRTKWRRKNSTAAAADMYPVSCVLGAPAFIPWPSLFREIVGRLLLFISGIERRGQNVCYYTIYYTDCLEFLCAAAAAGTS